MNEQKVRPMRPTYTQVFRDGRWQNVTAMRDGDGRIWWYLRTEPGEFVGFNGPTLDRMEGEGTARTLTESEYHRWADEATIDALLDEKALAGRGVN